MEFKVFTFGKFQLSRFPRVNYGFAFYVVQIAKIWWGTTQLWSSFGHGLELRNIYATPSSSPRGPSPRKLVLGEVTDLQQWEDRDGGFMIRWPMHDV